MNNIILEASGLSKKIDNENKTLSILNNVEFNLPKQTSVAIIGASGSGKSTLLALLAGLDLPTAGSIKINNQELTVLNENQRSQLRANDIGFVFQSFYLMEDLTAAENIALPLELFRKKDAMDIAHKWLNKLGLHDRADHFPKQLSGGEQQRVALCRAFAIKPSILFADEPTANLDEVTATIVIDHLFKLHKEGGNSMVIATHDWALANRCNIIYQLKSGCIHEHC